MDPMDSIIGTAPSTSGTSNFSMPLDAPIAKRKHPPSQGSNSSEDEDPWILVQGKAKQRNMLKSLLSTGAGTMALRSASQSVLPKFKVVSANSAEGYHKLVSFFDRHKGTKVAFSPNHRGRWVIKPLTEQAVTLLCTTSDLNLQSLDPEIRARKE